MLRLSKNDAPKGTLYVTRKFPPVVGGMEVLAARVWDAIASTGRQPRLVANRHGNRHLPWWLPWAAVQTAWHIARRRVDLVVAGDPVVLVVVQPFARLARIPTAVVLHGLDLTWGPRAYRSIVLRAVRRCAVSISISEATSDAAVQLGADRSKIHVVRPGLSAPRPEPTTADAAAAARATLRVGPDDIVIVTIGRLVRRKGALWFAQNVLPHLPSHVHFAVAGAGPDLEELQGLASTSPARERLHVLGKVDDATWEILMRGADVFVQPNIKVADDMEGFGLVTIEAALRGTWVVASGMEGILDAVIDGVTGQLLTPGDTDTWVAELTALAADPARLNILGASAAVACTLNYGDARFRDELLAELDQVTRRVGA